MTHSNTGWGWDWIDGRWDTPSRRHERDPFWHWHWFWWRPGMRPGSVPYRLRAWQPDVTAHTVEQFRRHLRPWAANRNVAMTDVMIDMNTGSTPMR